MLASIASDPTTPQRAWQDTTFVHPMALVVLGILSLWMFLAPRRTAIVPFIILICFIPSAQRIAVLGADFTLLRLMALVGLARVLCRSELLAMRFNRIDGVYATWVVAASVVYVLQQAQASAVVYVLGQSVDTLGAYFVARVMIQNMDDFRAFARGVALIAIPVCVLFAFELSTQRNLFAYFGGVREITWIRDGRLRCQGAFSHPILAGVFWAAIGALTLGGALARQAKPMDRWIFAAGTLSAVFIIVASASSTPVLGFAAGVFFWLWWPARGLMRYAFIATPFVLAGLHMVMQAPVWHLISRVSAVGGSTGWHRYHLIDRAIHRFPEWMLLGTPSTGHWGWGLFDVTNQYILEGVRGGMWRLGLFIALIYLVGRSIANAQARARNKADRMLLWGIGASVFVHCVCFIGVSYFGQIQYLWYITLAIGASMADPAFFGKPKNPPVRSPRPAPRAPQPDVAP
ncbi:MAG: hypothetical protein AAFX79_07150 [Planctomycetota bacterium]